MTGGGYELNSYPFGGEETLQLPQEVHHARLSTPLPDDEVTLPALLRQAGYEVAAFGKTHYYWPRRHEFDVCADWTEYEAWLSSEDPVSLLAGSDVLRPWRPFVDPAPVWLNSACLPYAAVDADMFGTFLASRAAQYLTGEKDQAVLPVRELLRNPLAVLVPA